MRILIPIFAILFSFNAFSFSGFVSVSEKQSLYVDWVKAQAGKPTVVLLNGLTYSTVPWTAMTKVLLRAGYGVLRYDMRAMGQTLLHDGIPTAPVDYKDQVKDLKALLVNLKIPAPYNLVGLSYGGGIGIAFCQQYSKDVGTFIAMAPYTEPMAKQDQWIQSQIWYTRQTFPADPSTDEELYDYFLKQIVYSTYPAAEPSTLQNPWILEGVFRMVQSIRHYKVNKNVVQFLPGRNFHLMIAGNDQYIERKVLADFWKMIPEKNRGSLIIVNNSEHKMPEAAPTFTGAWIMRVMSQDKIYHQGNEFEGDALSGRIKVSRGK